MTSQWRVLVVSKRPEIADKINSTLGRWGMVVVSCSSLAQARAILQLDTPQLIFCQDRLSDGSYRDLLGPYKVVDSKPRIVIVPSSEALLDSEFESAALKWGAYTVLGMTPEPVDIEWVVIRAIRDEAKRKVA